MGTEDTMVALGNISAFIRLFVVFEFGWYKFNDQFSVIVIFVYLIS